MVSSGVAMGGPVLGIQILKIGPNLQIRQRGAVWSAWSCLELSGAVWGCLELSGTLLHPGSLRKRLPGAESASEIECSPKIHHQICTQMFRDIFGHLFWARFRAESLRFLKCLMDFESLSFL